MSHFVRALFFSAIHTAAFCAQAPLLDLLEGIDLSKHRLSAVEYSDLEKIIGTGPEGVVLWRIWKVNLWADRNYIALYAGHDGMVPGGSKACVRAISSRGVSTSTSCFETGWRLRPDSVAIERYSALLGDVVVLQMARNINGRDIKKEYFAIRGDRVQLIRLEDSSGQAVANSYRAANLEIGIRPRASTLEEWVELLDSSDRVDVLSALVFLGGEHLTKQDYDALPPDFRPEIQDSLFVRLIKQSEIRERILFLSRSSDKWIQQAASLAAASFTNPNQMPSQPY